MYSLLASNPLYSRRWPWTCQNSVCLAPLPVPIWVQAKAFDTTLPVLSNTLKSPLLTLMNVARSLQGKERS